MKALVVELQDFCAGCRVRQRQERDYRGLAEGGAMLEIAADLDAKRKQCLDLAYAARVADDEGIWKLKEALADGRVDAGEILGLQQALRNFERSREADDRLAQSLA